jgi:lipoprotein NlpI
VRRQAHHQLSMVYSHIGLLDEAHQSVRRALEINPNNTMARFRVGVYYAYQGKFDDALMVFKTIPRDVSPMLIDRSIADALVQIGSLSGADEIGEHYLEKFPQDEGGSFMSVKLCCWPKKVRRRKPKWRSNARYELAAASDIFTTQLTTLRRLTPPWTVPKTPSNDSNKRPMTASLICRTSRLIPT